MRKSGILLHISSLSSPYGIGTLGDRAYRFIDFLKDSGQSLWQILPIGPTGYGNSPYSSVSAFAYNPYFIDIDYLVRDGLLSKNDVKILKTKNDGFIDYELLFNSRQKVLFKAFLNFKADDGYNHFCKQNDFWLEDYALFSAIKKHFNYNSWEFWEDEFRIRSFEVLQKFSEDNKEYIDYIKFTQYMFYKQWKNLRLYANANGVEIIGDTPIYAAYDSCDVWANPEMFILDEKLMPKMVAGVPPDSFTPDGQLWGNPLYNWEYLKGEGYKWWTLKVKKAFELFDFLRIDHFRGFESFYCIPYGDINAKRGVWENGPGLNFFTTIENQLGKLKIIAEDLGYLNDEVRKMVKDTGYPNMKILQFAFGNDENNEYLPHNYYKNCVVYTGTHDNNTTKAWFNEIENSEKEFFKKYFKLKFYDNPVNILIKTAYASIADYVIIPVQDFLLLGENARMNKPSTVLKNWIWRLKYNQLSKLLSKKILRLTKKYNRKAPKN